MNHEPTPPDAGLPHKPIRVLHLEDDPHDAVIIQHKLKAGGLACAITRVESQDRFETLLATESYDLILCDANLAGLKQARINSAAARIVGELGIVAIKYALDLNGYYGGPPRLPLLPLTGDLKNEVEQLMADTRN